MPVLSKRDKIGFAVVILLGVIVAFMQITG